MNEHNKSFSLRLHEIREAISSTKSETRLNIETLEIPDNRFANDPEMLAKSWEQSWDQSWPQSWPQGQWPLSPVSQ